MKSLTSQYAMPSPAEEPLCNLLTLTMLLNFNFVLDRICLLDMRFLYLQSFKDKFLGIRQQFFLKYQFIYH